MIILNVDAPLGAITSHRFSIHYIRKCSHLVGVTIYHFCRNFLPEIRIDERDFKIRGVSFSSIFYKSCKKNDERAGGTVERET